jgi:hypothetical protein
MTTIFKNWKARPSQLGNLMTYLTSKNDTENQKLRKSELLYEKKNLINKNGNKVKWTDRKQAELDKITESLNNPNPLPEGAKSYLDKVFNDVFWGRKRILYNKYLEKGTSQETDALELLSEVDGIDYFKNEEVIENNWVVGTPDNRQDGIIRDTKASYDLESYDKADLSSLYEWQIKAYCWIDNKTKGELCYCLVNTPEHHIIAETRSQWYAMGMPDEDNEEWIETKKQIERNMIFDPIRFKDEFPNYQFLNKREDLIIPSIFRVKKFEVEIQDDDIENMKHRIKLSRKYLCQKEDEVMAKLNDYAKNIEVIY